MSRKYFRARVYDPDDTTLDFTIGDDEFVDFPDRLGGQRVQLLEGRTETLNFQLAIKPSALTDHLSNPAGDADLLQRRIEVQVGGADVNDLLEVTPKNIKNLAGYTFSRTGTATYIDKNGVLQTAASGELRDAHYIGGVRHILLEGASTNVLLNSFVPANQVVSIPNSVHTLSIRGTGSVSATGATDGLYGSATASTHLTFTPTVTQNVTFTITGSVTEFQCEQKPFPTSFIETAGAAATRNADSLSVDFTAVPQEMTVYVKGVEFESVEVGTRLFLLGTVPSSGIIISRTNGYGFQHFETTSSDSFSGSGDVIPGRGVELRSILFADGSAQIGTSFDGAAETVATAGSAEAFGGSFSNTTLQIGSGETGALPGYFAFESIRIAQGVQTMADMRLASFKNRAGGRIVGIRQRPEDLAYILDVADERWVERNTVIFAEANTTTVFPPSEVLAHTLQFQPRFTAEITAATTNGTADFRFDEWRDNSIEIDSRMRDIIEEDIKPGFERRTLADGESRHKYLTLHLIANSTSDTVAGDYKVREINDGFLTIAGRVPVIRVIDSGGALSTGMGDRRAYLYLNKAPPSDDVPLHVPADSHFRSRLDPRAPVSRGIHPFQLLKNIYDGSYQQTIVGGTTETVATRTVSYSTVTLSNYSTSNKQGLVGNPKFPLVRFRITESEVMSEFLERSIFQPFNVLPIVDEDGSVRPTEFMLPTQETVASTTDLFTFGTSNLAETPTWDHGARDQLTAIRFRFPRFLEGFQRRSDRVFLPKEGAGLDLVLPRTHEVDFRHPQLTAGELIRRELIRDIPGTDSEAAGDNVADLLQNDLFDRYGYGPQRTRILATTAASTVLPGDLTIVNMAGFPNTAGSTRGNPVVMQVTGKIPRPDGYTFELSHVGAQLQPLPTPQVHVQRSTVDPRHTLRLNVTGWASTHDNAVYQLAETTGVPATTDWRNVGTNKATLNVVTSTGGVLQTNPRFTDVGDLKSGTRWVTRARLTRAGRIGSGWSTHDSTSTEALAAPTALGSTKQGGSYIDLNWQVGESDERVELLNPTTRRALLTAGSNQYRDKGLTVNTTYAYAVRHRDQFGGIGPATTKFSVSTSTDATDILMLSPPAEIVIPIGNNVIQAT